MEREREREETRRKEDIGTPLIAGQVPVANEEETNHWDQKERALDR